MLEDLRRGPLDHQSKPKLTDVGTFEGTMVFKWYRTAVEYAGDCYHCGGIVAGVVRIEDPRLQTKVRSVLQEYEIKQAVIATARARHQCPIVHDGKLDIDDWFKNIGVPST